MRVILTVLILLVLATPAYSQTVIYQTYPGTTIRDWSAPSYVVDPNSDLYLADIPYLFQYPGDLVANLDGMADTVRQVSKAGFQAWVEAVWAYRSQLSSLYVSPEGLRTALEEYWEDKRGISLWKPGA